MTLNQLAFSLICLAVTAFFTMPIGSVVARTVPQAAEPECWACLAEAPQVPWDIKENKHVW